MHDAEPNRKRKEQHLKTYRHGNIQFDLAPTKDGSPTLSINASEKMHHPGGAFSETLYIYGQPFQEWLQSRPRQHTMPIRALVVGLGLGYIEMALVALSIVEDVTLQITSFENCTPLKTAFQFWVTDQRDTEEFDWLFQTYDEIQHRCCQFYQIEPDQIRQRLHGLFQAQLFQVHDRFDLGEVESYISHKLDYVAYDAFSSHQNEDLWNGVSLKKFLEIAIAGGGAFCTYAMTGDLRRALIATGYKINKRFGFAGKRESTFAYRAEPASIIQET